MLSQLLLAGLHITQKVDGQPGTLPTATALDTSPICQDSWGLLDPCQAQRGFLPALEERGTPAPTGVLVQHTQRRQLPAPEPYIIAIGQWYLG